VRHEKNWEFKMVVNGFGSVCTLIVMFVFAYTKFPDGAWIVVLLTPTLVAIFFTIHHHYKKLAKALSLDHYGMPVHLKRQRVIMPIGGVHRGSLQALRFARTLSDDITAVHVSIDPIEARKVQEKWEMWGDGYRLLILDSPYRLFVEPLLEYIATVEAALQPNEMITIVVPQFVSRQFWANPLHTNTADTLRKALLYRKNIVIMEVPYQVD
jgi:hypothetical protein